METRQAHFRNMRSKCRCSCVLQFTRHHGVSSVLHRPQSQMIHCIVLCCVNSRTRVQRSSHRVTGETSKIEVGSTSQQGGDHKPGSRRGLFEPFRISHNPPHQNGDGRGTVPQQSRAAPAYGIRHEIEMPGPRRCELRQAGQSSKDEPQAIRVPRGVNRVSKSVKTSNR